MQEILTVFVLLMSSVSAFTDCASYYEKTESVTARRWCQQGSYFDFKSTIPANNGQIVKIFYNCQGQPTKRSILLVHGWPTSSYDYQKLVSILSQNMFVCAMDFPGHGFSEKPPHPFDYSMFDYAQALHQFVTKVVPLKQFMLLTHDEGDSVGLQFLRMYIDSASRLYTLLHHFIMNGSIYLPLAAITPFQKKLLDNTTGPIIQKTLTGKMLASSLGAEVYSPPLNKSETAELATVFDFQTGAHVLHETIQYLVERGEFENQWLDVLGKSPVPCTLIWGQKDPVAVPAVADYAWDNYLKNRPSATAEYIKIPEANHYIQHDVPTKIAEIIAKTAGYNFLV